MKLNTRRFSPSRGIALALTLIMLSVLYVLGVAFLSVSSQDYIFARKNVFRAQAYYLAESGVEYVLANRVSWVTYPHHEEFEFSGGRIIVDADESADHAQLTVSSTGEYVNFQHTIVVTFNNEGSVINWREQ